METELEVTYSNITKVAREAFALKRRIDKIRSRVALRNILVDTLPFGDAPSGDDWLQRDKQQILKSSKPDERAHPLFEALVSPNYMENLARSTLERFSLDPTQVQILLDFHRRSNEHFADLISTKPLATIVLVGGVLAKTVPKEAFEAANLQDVYGLFQLVVSILVLGSLIFFAGLLGVFRWSLSTSLAENRFCEQLLDMAELISRYDDRTRHQGSQHSSPESSERKD